MPACPSAEQIARYQRDSCLFPLDCLPADEVDHYRGCPEAFEREQGTPSVGTNTGTLISSRDRPGTLTPPRPPRMPPW